MEACKICGTSKPRTHAQGLKGKETSSPSSQRQKNALTLPLIDRDVTSINRRVVAVNNWDAIVGRPSLCRFPTKVFVAINGVKLD